MKTEFLPEWSQMSLGGQHVGLYRFFTTQSWRQLCDPKTKKKLLFGTASAAIAAARDHVRSKMNPDIRTLGAEPDDDSKAIADVLGIDEWRQSKIEERAENQILRNRKTMTRVKVERKGEGRRHVGKKG